MIMLKLPRTGHRIGVNLPIFQHFNAIQDKQMSMLGSSIIINVFSCKENSSKGSRGSQNAKTNVCKNG